MSTLATIGITLAIIAIIYLTARGINIVLAAPLATLIVILTNNMNIFEALIGKQNSYMVGLSNFLINNFAIFLLGSILAQYMEKSGATLSIANYIIKKIGKDSPYKMLIAITIVASILTYGGISIFIVIFAIIPLAKPLFKELNISWELFPIPVFLGASTYTMTLLPATPSIHNAIPTKVLGTTLTAAPLLSIAGTIVILIFGLLYMNYALKKSINNKETFNYKLDDATSTSLDLEKSPSVSLSIAPIILLISIIFIFSKTPNIILIALTCSILFSAIIFYKNIKNQKDTLNNGAVGAVIPAFATSSSVAFGTVLTTATGFELIRNTILNIPGSPLISLAVATALLSAITGSSSGALGIVMTTFIPKYMGLGIDPEVLHRVVVVASAALTVVPQSGVMITFHTLSGLSLKRGFKHSFIIVNIGHILALIAIILLATLLY